MNIYLIGMMGSGKSTVGKILAKKMAIPFIDLDHYIEVKNNKSITNIFKENGEAHFRELESDALSQIEESTVLVACGGGIVQNKTNREKLQIEIPSTVYTTYERLRKSKDGLAVSIMRGERCSACNISVPNKIAQAIGTPDNISFCNSCQRILITDD